MLILFALDLLFVRQQCRVFDWFLQGHCLQMFVWDNIFFNVIFNVTRRSWLQRFPKGNLKDVHRFDFGGRLRELLWRPAALWPPVTAENGPVPESPPGGRVPDPGRAPGCTDHSCRCVLLSTSHVCVSEIEMVCCNLSLCCEFKLVQRVHPPKVYRKTVTLMEISEPLGIKTMYSRVSSKFITNFHGNCVSCSSSNVRQFVKDQNSFGPER